jgi:uncharacterized protein (DUF342 family)
MSDHDFLNSIVNYAERSLKREITEYEREQIIDNFNSSKERTAYLRAIEALDKTFNIKVPKKSNKIILEKTANFDDINNKLEAMKREAAKWEANKNNGRTKSN